MPTNDPTDWTLAFVSAIVVGSGLALLILVLALFLT